MASGPPVNRWDAEKKEALKKYAELVGNLSAESGMSKLLIDTLQR